MLVAAVGTDWAGGADAAALGATNSLMRFAFLAGSLNPSSDGFVVIIKGPLTISVW